MRKVILMLILIIVVGSCKNTVKHNDEPNPMVEKITEDEALALLHKWTNAYLLGDANRLNEILDDSWIYSGSANGKLSNKTATIEEFTGADYKFQDIVYENLQVTLYGDIAVVRGSEKMTIVGNSEKDTTELKLRFTDVYQKKGGVVKAISTHSSPITEE